MRAFLTACAVGAALLVVSACSGPDPVDDDDVTDDDDDVSDDDDATVPDDDDAVVPGFDFGEHVECASPVAGIDRFSREADERGLDYFAHDQVPIDWRDCPPVHGGLVSTDIDADGDLDLLVHQPVDFPLVYLNDGSGVFTRQTVDLPTYDTFGRMTYSLASADLDGDGLPEIILAGPGLAVLSRNQGDGNWGDYEVWLDEPEGNRRCINTMVMGDADGDGDLDLFLPSLETSVEDEEWSYTSDPVGNANLLLLIEDAAVVQTVDLLGAGGPSFSVCAAFTDRDNDGDLDLFVSTDRPHLGNPPSAFYRNDGTDGDGAPILVDDAAEVGADIDMSGMGWATNDINGDGLLDYIVSDVGRLVTLVSSPVGYIESGAALGLVVPDPMDWFGWTVELVDFDNDGALDLASTSGFEASFGDGENDLLGRDVFFQGDGAGGFDLVSGEVGFDSLASHYGMVADDFDGDGYRDMIVAPLFSDSLRFYSNPCGDGHWLEIELVGPPRNREGFGARVEVVTSGRTDVQEIQSLRTLGQSATRVHVGLGGDTSAASVTVYWPGGEVSTADDVPADRLVTVTHPDAR